MIDDASITYAALDPARNPRRHRHEQCCCPGCPYYAFSRQQNVIGAAASLYLVEQPGRKLATDRGQSSIV